MFYNQAELTNQKKQYYQFVKDFEKPVQKHLAIAKCFGCNDSGELPWKTGIVLKGKQVSPLRVNRNIRKTSLLQASLLKHSDTIEKTTACKQRR